MWMSLCYCCRNFVHLLSVPSEDGGAQQLQRARREQCPWQGGPQSASLPHHALLWHGDLCPQSAVSPPSWPKSPTQEDRARADEFFFPLCRFQDPRSHRRHHAQVGFQVCVRPGSYKVGPQTLGHSEPLDPRFSNSEIEWITKEQGGTLLYGLLIRVEWATRTSASRGRRGVQTLFNKLTTKSNPCLERDSSGIQLFPMWIIDNSALLFS